MSQVLRNRRRADRAFATVLILLLLFMMLLLVITYLRTMRAYSLAHPQTGTGGPTVLEQLEFDIATTLGEDGRIGPTADENPVQPSVIHEPYDYPWTHSARFFNTCRLSYPRIFSSAAGMGDPQTDDAWLSPLEPDAAGKWPQVSNLFGSFLVYTNPFLTGIPQRQNPYSHDIEAVPEDAPAGAAIPTGQPAAMQLARGQSVDYRNLDTTDPRLVDADGDGVGDALWFYPRNNVVGGLRYVAAVRIVDLSGCLNLNTALGELGAAPGTQSGTPRKGEGPHEVDAGKMGFGLTAGSRQFRWATAPGTATDWDFWLKSGGQVDSRGKSSIMTGAGGRYTLSDEAQLRDFTNRLIGGTSLTPAPKLFNAASNGNAGHYGALPANLTRNRLTTISGISDRFAPPPFVSNGFAPRRAADLNLYQTDSAGFKNPPGFNNPADVGGDWPWLFWGGPTPIFQTFFGGPDNGTPGDDYPFPEGFRQLITGSGGTSSTIPLQYQIQLGLSLQDALKRDNRPTVGWSWMGWKPLPIMTEFYAQMPYVVLAPDVQLSSTPVQVFPNTTLAGLDQAKIENMAGKIGGANFGAAARSPVYQYLQNATEITFQYQQYRPVASPGISYTRAVGVKLTEVTTGTTTSVFAERTFGKYKAGDFTNSDFATLAGTTDDATYSPILGLPIAAGTTPVTWTQAYVNSVQNRTATDASVATMSTAGQQATFNQGGGSTATVTDPTTSTVWQATGIAGVGSYAFELANPYAIPIRLNNLRFKFRRQDRNDWSISGGNIQAPPSQDLSTYITAATGLAKDAEGHYVLKPQERIVFYRNGTEYAGPGGARRRPMGGPAYLLGAPPSPGAPVSTDISGLIATGPGIYKVNLGAGATPNALDTTAPDINAYPGGSWNVATIELEVNSVNAAGGNYGWTPYNHMVFQGMPSGDQYNLPETLVPDGHQAAPGDLIYHQQDVRTFGAEEKLNLLQARPACFPFSDIAAVMPVDMGDTELRTNFYSAVGSGVLPNGAAQIYPARIQAVSMGGANYWGHVNNATATMPLGHATSGLTYLSYDGTCGAANDRVSALGQPSKVLFRTPASGTPVVPFGGPNGNNAMYGSPTPARQDIRDGSLFFNYMGIPGDTSPAPGPYTGTFPELAASPNASPVAIPTGGRLDRDNATANSNNGKERRDGIPRAMDIGGILVAGPIWWNFATGNFGYRGTTANGGWGGGAGAVTRPTVDQLTNWYQYTIGDAINFHLAKDSQKRGIKGLCLRADKPFYDPATTSSPLLQGKTLDQLYADLAVTLPTDTAKLATLRAGIRAMLGGTISWADAAFAYYQVDSPKYKGRTGFNGNDFKPGTVNINTASQEVLKCLSLPPSVGSPDTFTAAILAARLAPADLAGTALPRKGIARIGELCHQGFAAFGMADADSLRDAVAWLPQQASCRSDVFCAYILMQGYKQDNFNLGPMDVRRVMVVYSRDTSGAPAAKLAEYTIPNK